MVLRGCASPRSHSAAVPGWTLIRAASCRRVRPATTLAALSRAGKTVGGTLTGSYPRNDSRHQADTRCDMPVLPGVHRRGVGTEKFRDMGLPEVQIEATGSNVIAECSSTRLGRRKSLVFDHLAAVGNMGPNDSRFGTATSSISTATSSSGRSAAPTLPKSATCC